jgi:hypothetical protein
MLILIFFLKTLKNFKMKKLLIGLFIVSGSTFAMSQSAFNGFYGQISAGYGTTTPNSEGGSGAAVIGGKSNPFTFVTDHNTHRDFMGTATVGYTFGISKKFFLGVGAEFTENDGSWTTITTTNNYNVKTTDEYKIAHSYHFFLSPAYAIDDDKLVSAKVGYARSLTENRITGTVSDNHQTGGYIAGLGYKQIIKGRWYGLAEVEYNRTANQTYDNSGVSVNGYPFTSTVQLNSHSYRLNVGIGFLIQGKIPTTK